MSNRHPNNDLAVGDRVKLCLNPDRWDPVVIHKYQGAQGTVVEVLAVEPGVERYAMVTLDGRPEYKSGLAFGYTQFIRIDVQIEEDPL